MDARCQVLHNEDPQLALNFLTDYSCWSGDLLVARWKDFFNYLFMRYMDGNLKQAADRRLLDNGNMRGIPARPSHPGYGKEWERKMMDNTGERFRVGKSH